MNRKLIGILLAASALALPWLDSILPKPGPAPTPDPAPGPSVIVPASLADSLKVGFAGSKQEAGDWAGLLYGMARTIEADKGHPNGPRLKTMIDVSNLRDWIVACPPKQLGKGDVFGQAIGPELAKLGTSDEPLDQDDRRSKVVNLFNGAAHTLEDLSK